MVTSIDNDELKELMQNMLEFGIEYVKVGDIELRARPQAPKPERVDAPPTPLPPELSQEQATRLDEELMFFSSGN